MHVKYARPEVQIESSEEQERSRDLFAPSFNIVCTRADPCLSKRRLSAGTKGIIEQSIQWDIVFVVSNVSESAR
jgi:hypothetical protein